MSIVVTGANGFLGRRLVTRLLERGDAVLAIGRGACPEIWAGQERLTWLRRDLAVGELSASDLGEPTVVFHLAGATLGARLDAAGYLAANEATLITTLSAAAGHGPRIVIASSQVVYGDANHLAVREDFPLDGSESHYAASKVNCETWARWFQRKHGGSMVLLRLSGFVEGGGAVDYFIDRALRGERLELFARGEIRRDYLAVDSGIDAFLAAADYHSAAGVTAFNIGSGESMSAAALAELVLSETRSSSEIHLTAAPAPQRDFVFDISLARRVLGFTPAALADTVRRHVRRRQDAAS